MRGMKNAAILAENTALKEQVSNLLKQLSDHESELALLREKIISLTKQRFGRSSEKLDSPQISLFDEAEIFADASKEVVMDEADASEETVTVPAHTRKKKRVSLPDSLPHKDVIHDLPEAEKICPHDGSALKQIGEEVSKQLIYIPATLEVIRHHRLKYACPCCDQHMVTARKPPQPIEKSFASASLLAYIILSKYADALPLYRQATMFKRLGVELDTTTLANWMIRCGELVQPLINLLYDKLREQGCLHMDETVVQVLKEAGRRADQESRMWVMATPTASEEPVVLFHYSETRSAEVVSHLLGDSAATVMTDGCPSYTAEAKQSERTLLGCWAHARRYFIEAQKAQPKGKQGKADQALSLIQKLYRIEAETRDGPPEVRFWRRCRESKALLDQLRKWLDKTLENPISQSLLGKAVTYLHNQWPKLVRYIENADWPIDNNRAENAIRPFVVGRKNWLFATSPKGANASANLYSLIETAKACGLEPGVYLEEILTKLPTADSLEDIEALLPCAVKADREKNAEKK